MTKNINTIKKKNEIFICFDFGEKNIGIAVGQIITKTATPLTTLRSKNQKINWIKIKKILQEWKPDKIIIGLPIDMNGKKLPITKKVYKFSNHFKKKFNLSVELEDERLTTKEAKRKLYEIGGYKIIKKKIHSESAAIILESWFKK